MNPQPLRDLILAAVPRNAGEADGDYFARCAAAAQAIADAANADPRTAIPIPLGDANGLRKYMSSLGLRSRLERTVADDAFAPFVTAANRDPATVADQVRDALSWIFDGNNVTLDTTDPTIAAQTDALLTLTVAFNGANPALGMTQAEADGFASRGGGYALRGATADAVMAEITAMAHDAAITALNLTAAAQANDRAGKLAYLADHPDAGIPADLAGLDAWSIPADQGEGA